METRLKTPLETDSARRRIAELEAEVAHLRADSAHREAMLAPGAEPYGLLEVVGDGDRHLWDLRILEANASLADLLGLPVEGMVGHTLRELRGRVPAEWWGRLRFVALRGTAIRFAYQREGAGRCHEVHAWSPGPGRCAMLIVRLATMEQEAVERRMSEHRPHVQLPMLEQGQHVIHRIISLSHRATVRPIV